MFNKDIDIFKYLSFILIFFILYMINPYYTLIFIALIISCMIHEIAHGYTALLLGDNTAKLMGRLSLNPFRHFVIENLFLPILLLFIHSPIIFTSAIPVPVNDWKFKRRKLSVIIVSLSGIMANILIYFLVRLILLKLYFYIPYNWVYMFLLALMRVNLWLALFNLIPIPPLDGSRVLEQIFPSLRSYYIFLERQPLLSLILAIAIMNLISNVI